MDGRVSEEDAKASAKLCSSAGAAAAVWAAVNREQSRQRVRMIARIFDRFTNFPSFLLHGPTAGIGLRLPCPAVGFKHSGCSR